MKSWRTTIGTVGRVRRTFYPLGSEAASDPDATPSVSVTRHDGTSVSGVSVASLGSGVYEASVPAQTSLDRLSVRWDATYSGAAQRHFDVLDVAGARWFDLATLRAQQGLSNTSTFPLPLLESARVAAEDFCEAVLGIAQVPRLVRWSGPWDGTAERAWVRPVPVRKVRRALVDDDVKDVTDWKGAGTWIALPAPVPGTRAEVWYEAGLDAPPADLAQACLMLARHLVLGSTSSVPDRARSLTTEVGTFHLNVASEQSPTGLPEVDATLVRHRDRRPVIA